MSQPATTSEPSRLWYHICIDTPPGHWVQADFRFKPDMDAWLITHLAVLHERWGQHEWFKVRIETWSDA